MTGAKRIDKIAQAASDTERAKFDRMMRALVRVPKAEVEQEERSEREAKRNGIPKAGNARSCLTAVATA